MGWIIKCSCGEVYEPKEEASVFQCPECGELLGE